MTTEALAGTGVMQSPEEWDARNRILADSMSALINRFAGSRDVPAERGIDVGCQKGALTDAMERATPFTWTGIDPTIVEPRNSELGLPLLGGTADALPFESQAFDVALFANVYEHVLPRAPRGLPLGDSSGPKASRIRCRADSESIFPDRVPQSPAVHGLAADQGTEGLLEAVARPLGARLLRRDDASAHCYGRASWVSHDPRREFQLPPRGDSGGPAQRLASHGAANAPVPLGLAVRSAADGLVTRPCNVLPTERTRTTARRP